MLFELGEIYYHTNKTNRSNFQQGKGRDSHRQSFHGMRKWGKEEINTPTFLFFHSSSLANGRPLAKPNKSYRAKELRRGGAWSLVYRDSRSGREEQKVFRREGKGQILTLTDTHINSHTTFLFLQFIHSIHKLPQVGGEMA